MNLIAAFDLMSREIMWNTLKKFKFAGKLIKVVCIWGDIYTD